MSEIKISVTNKEYRVLKSLVQTTIEDTQNTLKVLTNLMDRISGNKTGELTLTEEQVQDASTVFAHQFNLKAAELEAAFHGGDKNKIREKSKTINELLEVGKLFNFSLEDLTAIGDNSNEEGEDFLR